MSTVVGLLGDCPPGLPGRAVGSEEEAREGGLPLVMGYHQGRLSLWVPGGKETPLSVDFSHGKQGYRLDHDRVRHERLVKALGKSRDGRVRVVDATAGLGRDAALMAQAGFQVILIERSPLIHALLADGLSRAPAALQAPMTLLPCQDSRDLHDAELHAVYLDPMFPSREKSAAVKKDLLWLQWINDYPSQQEEQELMDWALAQCPHRVVVKRPAKAPDLAGRAPGFSQKGKAVRFDVYPFG